MGLRIIQGILLIIALFFAATNWDTYIREKRYEKDGWFALMAALAATLSATYIWFN